MKVGLYFIDNVCPVCGAIDHIRAYDIFNRMVNDNSKNEIHYAKCVTCNTEFLSKYDLKSNTMIYRPKENEIDRFVEKYVKE